MTTRCCETNCLVKRPEFAAKLDFKFNGVDPFTTELSVRPGEETLPIFYGSLFAQLPDLSTSLMDHHAARLKIQVQNLWQEMLIVLIFPVYARNDHKPSPILWTTMLCKVLRHIFQLWTRMKIELPPTTSGICMFVWHACRHLWCLETCFWRRKSIDLELACSLLAKSS